MVNPKSGTHTALMHQSIPPAPSPPAFASLVSPGGGALANLARSGAGHWPAPGAPPGF